MIVPDAPHQNRALAGADCDSPISVGTAVHGTPGLGHVDCCLSRANNRVKCRRMKLRRALSIILICASAWAHPQSPVAPSSSPALPGAIAERDPEDAFLSTSRYTNAYFGFEFDFPPEARLDRKSTRLNSSHLGI